MQISVFCRSLQKKSWEEPQTIKEIIDIQEKLNKINESEADVVKQEFRSRLGKHEGFDVKCQT
jgi:hypothetical protein